MALSLLVYHVKDLLRSDSKNFEFEHGKFSLLSYAKNKKNIPVR